ncbi:MAG: hypothetical protein KatS3mg102_2274 [Planctomycetota bacterium]|nr:MAG: hypothetical protein KatS3mg102_2274 [Planctomycetota bacterium]
MTHRGDGIRRWGKPPVANGEHGSAFILGLVIATVLLVGSAAFVGMAGTHSHASTARVRGHALQAALEGASAITLARVREALAGGSTPPAFLRGQLQSGPAAGAWWSAVVRRHAVRTDLWKASIAAALHRTTPALLASAPPYAELENDPDLGVEGTATSSQLEIPPPESYQVHEVIFQVIPPVPPKPAAFRGALSSYYGFTNIKNATIDGNDHKLDGALNPAGDTYAISVTDGNVTFKGGAGQLGGNGEPLAHVIDEARVEDDYDGEFPTTPWQALDMTEADFLARSTRFDTLAEWNAFVDALPEVEVDGERRKQMPPNQFLYLTFQYGGSQIFSGIDWGNSAHILVWHHENPSINSDRKAPKGDAWARNIHLGQLNRPFRGIAILDQWQHVNGQSHVYGGFICLSGVGPQDGLQAMHLTYSSEGIGVALAQAGGVEVAASAPRVVSYRESVDSAEVRLALGAIGADHRESPPPSSTDWVAPGSAGGGGQ